MRTHGRLTALGAVLVLSAVAYVAAAQHPARLGRGTTVTAPTAPPGVTRPPRAVVDRYCLNCHNETDYAAELAFETLDIADVPKHAATWEKVVRKLRARHMPPIGQDRPDEATYDSVASYLESALDRAAAAKPDPGRTASIRRLTRTEYQNAIRDLLALDLDVASLLPADDPSYGFDNVTVGELSPTLLERYVSAAERISRIAVGRPARAPGGETFRVPADLTQEDHVEGLPIGTRGGTLIRYTFPRTGEYEFQMRLTRDRDEHVEGLTEPHALELLIDGERIQVFTINPPRGASSHASLDQHLQVRVPVTAGPHSVGVTFLKKPSLLLDTPRQPYQARFNSYRHPRTQPALFSVSILGPYGGDHPGDTPSRRRLFIARPADIGEEDDAARRILTALMRRAYRRPVTDADLRGPFAIYRNARAEGDFEAGVEMALAAVLVSPHFLFRIEQDPPGVPPNTAYRITGLELASRLSSFLWSSLPDDELLDEAIGGTLHHPRVLERQVRRMLTDSRSQALVTNFAAQWLHLRSLDAITPDMRLFPDFDHNLRQAFRRETELLFESVLREDRSVLDLLRANYTFVNERLARHYGIPHVYGSRFRRVTFDGGGDRGGLLRHGSILMVTSYATRTSPVVRGKWILETLLGVPPPPPPPDVPALKDNTVDGSLSVRERLAEHRRDRACAACHDLMDPIGLALERYDAVGRRRQVEGGRPIDASGALPDGSTFEDVDGLEAALLQRPELFVRTVAEKLLTYGLGRGVEPSDAPAVRAIVREAGATDFRLSSIVLGVAKSNAFQMRMSR